MRRPYPESPGEVLTRRSCFFFVAARAPSTDDAVGPSHAQTTRPLQSCCLRLGALHRTGTTGAARLPVAPRAGGYRFAFAGEMRGGLPPRPEHDAGVIHHDARQRAVALHRPPRMDVRYCDRLANMPPRAPRPQACVRGYPAPQRDPSTLTKYKDASWRPPRRARRKTDDGRHTPPSPRGRTRSRRQNGPRARLGGAARPSGIETNCETRENARARETPPGTKRDRLPAQSPTAGSHERQRPSISGLRKPRRTKNRPSRPRRSA